MVSMKLEDAQVHRMRLIPGLQLQVILLILSGAPGLASANGTRCLPDFENIGGRNYRGTSYGTDAPARGMFLRYRIPF